MSLTKKLTDGIALFTETTARYFAQKEGIEADRQRMLSEAEAKKIELQEQVDGFVNNRGQIMGVGQGAATLNVASFFDNTSGAGYLHLKTPITGENSEMVYLQFRGYGLYTSNHIVDDIASCYQYNSAGPSWVDVKGSHEPYFYIGSDNYLYVRLTIDNFYYLTVSVDATKVGNGRLLEVGSCEFIKSDQETL